MKFNRFVSRITFFWTAFALSVLAVSLFSGATIFKGFYACEWTEESKIRRAKTSAKLVSSDDYAVFSAVMEQRLSFRETYVVGIAVFDETPETASRINREYYALSGETLDNYIVRNRESRLLENRFELKSKSPVVLLNDKEEDLFFEQNAAGWDKFFEKFPNSGGIIHFSNVGYNREKTEALVRVKYMCALCEVKETFYSLTKSDANWRDHWRVKQ